MREIYIFLGGSTARLRHELTSIWGEGVLLEMVASFFFNLLFYSEIFVYLFGTGIYFFIFIFILKQSWFVCLKLRWNWTDSLVIVRFAFASNETEDSCSLFSLHWVFLFCFFVYIQLRPHLTVVFLRQFNLFANLHLHQFSFVLSFSGFAWVFLFANFYRSVFSKGFLY